MKDTFKKGVTLGLGLASASKEHTEKMIDELMKKGELTKEESDDLFNQIRKKGEESQSQMDQKIQQKLKKTLEELNVVTKEDLRAIEQRLGYLENQMKRDS